MRAIGCTGRADGSVLSDHGGVERDDQVWLVLGYTWSGGQVVLRLREDGGGPLAERPLGEHLVFEVLEGKRCTGLMDDSGPLPCPDSAEVTRGLQCDACQSRDAFRPCMMCDGFRCPRLGPGMRRYCRQRHHLYLACFGDETIKVGTASEPRRRQRIVEQGPLAAARVAKAEGPRIKQMEHLLSAEGFTENMRRSRKTALLRGHMTEVRARDLIIEAWRQLRPALPREYHALVHAPDFVQQPELAVRSRGLQVNPLPVQEGRVYDGAVVGAVGHVVFLEDDDGQFALDVGELKGRRITFAPQGPGKKASVQLGLF